MRFYGLCYSFKICAWKFHSLFFMKFNFKQQKFWNFILMPFFCILMCNIYCIWQSSSSSLALSFIDASSVHARLGLFDNSASMVFYLARISTPLETHAVCCNYFWGTRIWFFPTIQEIRKSRSEPPEGKCKWAQFQSGVSTILRRIGLHFQT